MSRAFGGDKPWQSFFTFEAVTRTKSVAQVMHEAAEEEGELDGVDANGAAQSGGLAKVLTVWDIIAYGIGSTLGAGIFAITASGCAKAGPAIVLSFIVAAIACLFSAFSYMEFAARVPIAGSAYTFTYVCLGELAAWFVGWNLTLEYAISAAVVARTWSQNLQLFINNIGGDYPAWLTSYSVNGGGVISDLSPMSAVICLVCMGILLMGVKESSNFNMFITGLNLSVILFIIILGSFHMDTANWTKPMPFNYTSSDSLTMSYDVDPSPPEQSGTWFPFGVNGVVTGAAVVFFSYIGFDSVTTLAEEVKNPKRDLPIGIMATLAVSTALYIATTLVVTAMQPWYILKDDDAPLANAFQAVGVKWASTLISAATVTALTGNTLTSLFGQPRIFYRMAKDGLLFAPFAKLHAVTKAPLWGTIYTGVGAGLIAFLIPLDSLANMISIGTLLAFSTVCAGVVILRYERLAPVVDNSVVDNQRLLSVVDQTPYSPLRQNEVAPISYTAESSSADSDIQSVNFFGRVNQSPVFWLAIFLLPCIGFCVSLRHTATCPWPVIVILGLITIVPVYMISRLPVCMHNWPKPGNFVCPLVPWLPCLGIFTNCYLITSLDWPSYLRIVVWTTIGMTIYFLYGIFHSTLLEKMTRYNQIQANANKVQTQSTNGHDSVAELSRSNLKDEPL